MEITSRHHLDQRIEKACSEKKWNKVKLYAWWIGSKKVLAIFDQYCKKNPIENPKQNPYLSTKKVLELMPSDGRFSTMPETIFSGENTHCDDHQLNLVQIYLESIGNLTVLTEQFQKQDKSKPERKFDCCYTLHLAIEMKKTMFCTPKMGVKPTYRQSIAFGLQRMAGCSDLDVAEQACKKELLTFKTGELPSIVKELGKEYMTFIIYLLDTVPKQLQDVDNGYHYLFLKACEFGSTELVEKLSKQGFNFKRENYHAPVCLAASYPSKTLLSLVLNKGGKAQDVDKFNHTPLHYAATQGYDQHFNYLVMNGADVNAQNWFMKTPLHDAVENKKTQAAFELIKLGACPFLADNLERTPLILPECPVEILDYYFEPFRCFKNAKHIEDGETRRKKYFTIIAELKKSTKKLLESDSHEAAYPFLLPLLVYDQDFGIKIAELAGEFVKVAGIDAVVQMYPLQKEVIYQFYKMKIRNDKDK